MASWIKQKEKFNAAFWAKQKRKLIWIKQKGELIWKRKFKIVEIECPDCVGTGLISGHFGQEDVASVCEKCEGDGMVIFKYAPFLKRKKNKNIRLVYINSGVSGEYIEYDEFLEDY